MSLNRILKLAACALLAGVSLSCLAQETDSPDREAVREARSQSPLPKAPTKALPKDSRVVFLHHSTGECIWNGGVEERLADYNRSHRTKYRIDQQAFPKDSPYGWENYPFDYWNIWVKHAGAKPFKQEPTLEMLTAKYNVIVFKHCFPVSNIEEDTGEPDIASPTKSIENYKRQYAALKRKMRTFPKNRFLVWTGAAQIRSEIEEPAARRAKAFFEWVVREWDEPGDNIFVWDFYGLETEGGIYLKSAYSSGDSHPNEAFSRRIAPLLCQRIVDVIEGRGDTGDRLGWIGEDTPVPEASETPSVHSTPEPSTSESDAPAAGDVSRGNALVFDDAEKPSLVKQWQGAGRYLSQKSGGHVIALKFADTEREDWGEYGLHRAIHTQPASPAVDLSEHRYVALRVKSKQALRLVFSLVTLPRPEEGLHQSHFAFSAYIDLKPNQWTPVALDLTRLELAAEGSEAYETAGSPTRPMQLTLLKLALHEKHAQEELLIDDVVFFRSLPEALEPALTQP
jgi:hypothetical protein